MSAVPKLAVWLLRRRLSREWVEFVVGDLEEGMARRGRRSLAARRWLWRETARMLLAPLPSSHVQEVHARAPLMLSVSSCASDCRYAIRSLRQAPWYSITAIGVVGLSIALGTTVFALVDGVLFKPLPYERAGELHVVSGGFQQLPDLVMPSASLPDTRKWTEAIPEAQFASFTFGGAVTVSDTEYLRAAEVDQRFFDVLGVHPLFGGFEDTDFAAPVALRPALMTHAVWQRWFGADRAVIGRTLADSRGRGLRIAGVLPREFVFPHPSGRLAPEAILPLRTALPAAYENPQRRWLQLLARVPPGLSPGAVETRLGVAAAEVARAFPPLDSRDGISAIRRITRGPFDVVRLRPVGEVLTENTRAIAAAVFATVAALLLLACLNLAGLSAGRSLDRRQELALRRALGATGGRLTQLLATEHAVLISAGASVGLLAARWLLELAGSLAPADILFLKPPAIDGRSTGFTMLASAASLAVITAWSVRTVMRAPARPTLADAGGTTQRAGSQGRRVLIAVQVAIAVLMAVAGSLFAGSLHRVWQEDPGFVPDRSARLRLNVPEGFGLPGVLELLLAVSRMPGVTAAGALNEPFLERAITGSSFVPPPGAAEPQGDIENLSVSSGFFRATGLHALEGRLPTAEEFDHGRPVVVVSRHLAELYWPGQRAVGQILRADERLYEVIGVVGNARYRSLDSDPAGEIYSAIAEHPGIANLVIAFDDAADRPIPGILREMAARFPRVRVVRAETLEAALGVSVQTRRFQTWLFVGLGSAALAIAGAGILGLIGMSVRRRTREVGVRMALGATPAGVVQLILREQLASVLGGLMLGAAAASWAVRLLESYLYKLSIYDPIVWGAALGMLLLVAAAGTLIPAFRAARVDPILALRHE